MSTPHLDRLQRRLDAEAIDQLRAEVVRLDSAHTQLAEENARLRTELAMTEDDAEFWRREATEQHLQLCEAHLGQPGITQAGHLLVAQGRH